MTSRTLSLPRVGHLSKFENEDKGLGFTGLELVHIDVLPDPPLSGPPQKSPGQFLA